MLPWRGDTFAVGKQAIDIGATSTMKSPVCEMLGVEFPLFAFSHCRDVVAAVSRAGGFGVLGATTHSPETIEQELKHDWLLRAAYVGSRANHLSVTVDQNPAA